MNEQQFYLNLVNGKKCRGDPYFLFIDTHNYQEYVDTNETLHDDIGHWSPLVTGDNNAPLNTNEQATKCYNLKQYFASE